VVWLGDTGAYLGGRAFGKHKLHERISPKKTWEGSIAGLLASVASALVMMEIYQRFELWEGPPLRATDCVALGIFGGMLGQVGDLAESLLKRAVGVKDSGTMFPGHGGMLDRIDALLFALPGVYFYAKYVMAFFPL
jgi:phosphatidate cytidylyltransferase